MQLSGRTALVTGASRGIGRAIANRLAADGATVLVHYSRGAANAAETVASISATGGRAAAIRADLGQPDDVVALVEQVHNDYGPVDILVNNAGLSFQAVIEDTTPEMFDRLIAVNLRGPYFLTQLIVTRMPDGGRIVNISSVSTRVALPRASAYGLTKAGMQNLTLSLAQHLGPRGITVNAVVPGVFDTEMNAAWLSEDASQRLAGQTALGRIGTVNEIANVVAFLASPESSWVTAQLIECSGGMRL